MPTVHDIERALYDWAPRERAADWDNVGLLVGDGDREVLRTMIALDVTEEVVEEAIARRVKLIVAHHPVLNSRWHEVRSVVEDGGRGSLLCKLIRHDVAAICMHTNLDAADGGVNDVLAKKLGLADIAPLGEDGIGRVGTLPREKSLEEFLADVVQSLNCKGLRYRDGGKPARRVAVGGGACAEYLPRALALGCDTFVTADLKYHEFLDARGVNLIDAGHFETENPVCAAVRAYLAERFPRLELVYSTSHAESVIQYYTT